MLPSAESHEGSPGVGDHFALRQFIGCLGWSRRKRQARRHDGRAEEGGDTGPPCPT